MIKKFATIALLLPAICWSTTYEGPFTLTWWGTDLSQQTFFVGVSPASTSSPCARKDEFKWNLSSPGMNQLVATLISAKAQGKTVHFGVSTSCVANQVTADFVVVDQ